MTKKGPLSKAEKFYIENNRHLAVSNMCTDLDRSKTTVQKFLKTLPSITLTDKEEVTTEIKDSAGMQQFARNGKGSTVMTENASQLGDSFVRKGPPERSKRCVTEIRK